MKWNAGNILQVVFLILLFLVGLLGNFSTCMVIKRNLRLQNVHNVLIVNLVTIDLVVVLFSMFPVITATILDEWPFDDVFCQISGYVLVIMNIASLWNVVALSVCRYLLFRKPIIYAFVFVRKNMILLLLGIWSAAVVSSSVVYGVGNYRYFPKFHICYAGFDDVKTNMIVLGAVVFIPTAFVVVLSANVYTTIQLKRQKSRQTRRPQRRSVFEIKRPALSNQNTEKWTAYTYLILVIVIAVCWGPLLIIHTINQAKPDYLNRHVYSAGTIFGFLPFVLKPIVFLVMKTEFRREFLKMYTCKHHVESTTFTSAQLPRVIHGEHKNTDEQTAQPDNHTTNRMRMVDMSKNQFAKSGNAEVKWNIKRNPNVPEKDTILTPVES